MNEPVIYFKGYKIKKYNYISRDEKLEIEDGKLPFNMSVNPRISSDFKNGYIVVSVTLETEDFSVEIVVEAEFDINVEGKENIEKFLVVNGTAIVFPYIRSMVSMLTSLDSGKAFILPTINTLDLIPNK
ncbi:hypothetical protein B40_0487 [Lactococcus cremoris]|uniref:protein-export chaperone SecB n=1 Tax=Lactococcus lactis subsp. cremoris TaxID=1359 RepID=UPI0007AE6475|nr:protein-export chaperone SecB [Lactococcus cremoris]KZK46760.1 hypothetical protein B40_0487 [Lactococcus cremoris]